MTFQIKDFRSIVASMINVSRASQSQITDYSVGSVARTLMEAPATEIEDLYLQMLIGLQEAIPTSVYSSFYFDRLAATGASGIVRFSAASAPASAVLIPSGTAVKSASSNLEYVTKADGFISAGSTYVDLMVYCTTAGIATNCASGSLNVLVNSVSGVSTVSNALAFTNGNDPETDAQRKTRFQFYISSLARGTASALKYGASQSVVLNAAGSIVERAAQVAVIEPYILDSAQPVALVNLYIHNGSGGTSAALLAQVTKDINGYYKTDGTAVPGWKSAGVSVNVYAAGELSTNVTGVLTMTAESLRANAIVLATEAIRSYIKGLSIGALVIRSELIAIIMSIDGVFNVSLSLPAADVAVSASQKAMPGTITLT